MGGIGEYNLHICHQFCRFRYCDGLTGSIYKILQSVIVMYAAIINHKYTLLLWERIHLQELQVLVSSQCISIIMKLTTSLEVNSKKSNESKDPGITLDAM